MFSVENYIKKELTTEPYYSEVQWVFDNGTGIIDFTSQDKAVFGFLLFNLMFQPNINIILANAANTQIFGGVGLLGSNNFVYVIKGTRFFIQGVGPASINFGFNYQVIYGRK